MILRVFFVLKDTVTPTKVSIAMVVLNFALNLTLVWFMQEGGIAAGDDAVAGGDAGRGVALGPCGGGWGGWG